MSLDDTTPLDATAPTEPTAPAEATERTADTTDPATPAARRPRIGTIVWGLVIALVGVGVTALGAGASLDLQAALIGLLVIAGTALLVGALVTAHRATRT